MTAAVAAVAAPRASAARCGSVGRAVRGCFGAKVAVPLLLSVLLCLSLLAFQRGFLPVRRHLALRSECGVPPKTPFAALNDVISRAFRNAGSASGKVENSGCWMPRPHKKVTRLLYVVIDALRYDFALDRMPFLANGSSSFGGHARLFHSVADPPTTTMQRLKALGTGSLPVFLEMKDNFAFAGAQPSAKLSARDDTFFDQLRENTNTTKRFVFLGDDTWVGMYGHLFGSNMRPFDSFNVWDLHSVDNGVLEHLYKELEKPDWSLLVAHFLGVDHAGHRFNAFHSEMDAKLAQMDSVVRRLAASIDSNTLLVVLGDHGMDDNGEHGGASDQEVSAALWFYSKENIFAKETPQLRKVRQVDLVPTLALVMGVPIPASNIGTVIPELFSTDSVLQIAEALNAAQVWTFLTESAKAAPSASMTAELPALETLLRQNNAAEFLSAAASICRLHWTEFQTDWMILGILGAAMCFLGLVIHGFSFNMHGFLNAQITGGALEICFSMLYLAAVTVAPYSNSFVESEDFIVFYILQALLLVPALLDYFKTKQNHPFTLLAQFEASVLLWLAHLLAPCHPVRETFYCPGSDLSSRFQVVVAIIGGVALLRASCSVSFQHNRPIVDVGRTVLLITQAAYWLAESGYAQRAYSVLFARVHAALFFILLFLHTRRKSKYINSAQELRGLLIAGAALLFPPRAQLGLAAGCVALNKLSVNRNSKTKTQKYSTLVRTCACHMIFRTMFYFSGHQASLASIQWNVGLTGLWNMNQLLSGSMVALNFCGVQAILAFTGVTEQNHISAILLLAIEAWHALHASIAAFALRRSLHLWAVFAPRWLMAVSHAITFGVVYCAILLV